MISERSIQEVIEQADIVDIVEDYVSLKRRGSNMIGLCPFHTEKTPSFSVSPSKNIYKCFGCGKAGGPIQFVMEHDQLSFPEAIRLIAKKYQIELEEEYQSEEVEERLAQREKLFLINEAAQQFYADRLINSDSGKSIGLPYLKQRGYSSQTILKFGLGYATNGGRDLLDHLTSKGFNQEEMTLLGLLNKSGFDFFNDRIIFPLHGISGKIVGLAGRTLKSDKRVPKYMNSPESEIYHKSKFLYGAFFAKSSIRKHRECILVEGYTDVISLHEAGIQNVVASSGTALTVDQIRIIKRYADNILVIYDGDSAGLNAAMRGIDLILEQDLNVKILTLPDGEDPDSFVSKVGQEEFKRYQAENSKDFIVFKTTALYEESKNDPIRRAGMIKDIVGSIARIPDSLKRSVFIQECSKILEIQEDILINETNKQIRGLIKKANAKDYASNSTTSKKDYEFDTRRSKVKIGSPEVLDDFYQEQDLLRILLMHGNKEISSEEDRVVKIGDIILEVVSPLLNAFDNDTYKEIFRKVLEDRNELGHFDFTRLIHNSRQEISKICVSLLSSPHEYSKNWEERWRIFLLQKPPEQNEEIDVRQGILRFQLRKLNKLLNEQKTKISEVAPADSEELTVQLQVYSALLEKRNSIAKELQMTIW